MGGLRQLLCDKYIPKNDTSHLERLRPCGPIEAYSAVRHDLDSYTSVALTATYSCPKTSHTLRSLMFAALRVLINRHPVLSAVTVDEHKSKPYFARLPSIDLRTCTLFVERQKPFLPTEAGEHDQELEELLESQHRFNWKGEVGTKPCWRAVIIYSPDINNEFMVSWFYHHAISDGTSGLVFHRSFLAALNSFPLDTPLQVDEIVSSPTTPLIPPLEKLHKLPVTIPFALSTLWKDLTGKRHPGLWTGAKIPTDPTLHPLRLCTLVFSKNNTTALTDLSRENKTTLTGTLETATASALLAALDPTLHDRITVDGAMTMRRYLSLADRDIEDEIGAWVTQYRTEHVRPAPLISNRSAYARPYDDADRARETAKTSPTALDIFTWAEARATRAVIAAEVAKEGKNSLVGLLRWLGNQHRFWRGKIGKERTDALEVTNVGRWKAKAEEEKGEWRVGRVVFTQDCAVLGPAMALSVVTGGDGCLVLAIEWREGIVEKEVMQRVVEGVEICLRGLLEGGKRV
ncbi:carboxypeptidase s [Stemphylium lycopersici]|nr:carboxypeptidase s [Stemphylium lycopersici]